MSSVTDKTTASKVTAATVAAGIVSYVASLVTDKTGVSLDPAILSLVVAAITSALVWVAGYLKREHVISRNVYEDFVGSEDDKNLEAVARDQVERAGKHRDDSPDVSATEARQNR